MVGIVVIPVTEHRDCEAFAIVISYRTSLEVSNATLSP